MKPSRRKHKKLYYVPGLVSLILVPLLFAHFGEEHKQELNQRVIEVNFWNPAFTNFWRFPERNYKQFILTGNPVKDEIAFKSANFLIQDIYSKADTINGVHLVFQDSVKYGTFVNLLNHFKSEKKLFLLYQNNLWVSHPIKPKPYKMLPPRDCLLCDDVVVIPPVKIKQSTFSQIRDCVFSNTNCFKNLWPSLAILILLAILFINQLVKIYKTSLN